ncbi:MAG: type II secretion system protein [Pirellulales bacterium]
MRQTRRVASQRIHRSRAAFSLVELVVVILILGIIAAVATPKMFDTASTAKANATQQSLGIVRNAIDTYRSQNSGYPTAANLKTALASYMRGQFPAPQVGANLNNNVVVSTQSPITSVVAGGAGWAYNETTGDIAVNDASYIAW